LFSGRQLPADGRPGIVTVQRGCIVTEVLFFVRHFGVMIEDLVPEIEEVWQLYIRFIQILDIVTAPFVDTNLTTYLTTLIAEHHELYCKLFSKTLKTQTPHYSSLS